MAGPEAMPEQNSNPPASLAGFLLRSFDYTTQGMREWFCSVWRVHRGDDHGQWRTCGHGHG